MGDDMNFDIFSAENFEQDWSVTWFSKVKQIHHGLVSNCRLYLSLVLGNVNVTLLSKQSK